MNAPINKRRLPQFSLRALLLVTLVVAAFFAGRASLYSSLQRERQRVEAAETAEMAWKLKALRDAEIRGELIDAAPQRPIRR